MSESINIKVRYFAQFREQAGVNTEQLILRSAAVKTLYEMVCSRHGFALSSADVKVAVNDEFVDWSHALQEGDTVVFIPPVAGG